MNTAFSRISAIFAFTLSVLATMTIICALSTYFKIYEDTVSVQIKTIKADVKVINNFGNNRDLNDLCHLTFNLDADFSKTFDWNTKQLYLYLTAHYSAKNNIVNQVVLWDYIMKRDSNYKLKLRNANTKYYFFHDGTGLLNNKNITLNLSMNIIPNVGVLKMATAKEIHQFSL